LQNLPADGNSSFFLCKLEESNITMAIVRKPLLPLKGRYGRVVFYRLPCGLICRFLTTHTRKRILKDAKFAEFRKCSKLMGKASKIGSAVYKALPEDFREFWMYRAFVDEAFKMLKSKTMTGQQALESLFRTYVEVWYIKAEIKEAERVSGQRSIMSTTQDEPVTGNIRRKEYNVLNGLNHFRMITSVGGLNNGDRNYMIRSAGMGPPVLDTIK